MLDVLSLRVDARKQCPTCKFQVIFDFPQARPLDLTVHTLNRGTKKTGASSTYFSAWVGHTHLNIFETMPKPRPHKESFEKMYLGNNFLPAYTVWGLPGRLPATFSERF